MSCNSAKIYNKLEIINLQKHYSIDKNSIKKIVRSVLKVEKKDAELNVVFTDNKRIKEINKTFLGHNYATDVITFAYHEPSLNEDKASYNLDRIASPCNKRGIKGGDQERTKKTAGKKGAVCGNTLAGEIIISVEMAKKLAQKHDCTVEGEIALYLVHGLLHLFGYNDEQKSAAKKMHQREGELLSSLGLCVPIPH